MKINKLIYNFFSFIFIISILIYVSKKMALQLFIFFGEKNFFYFSDTYLQIWILISIFMLLIVKFKNSEKVELQLIKIYPVIFFLIVIIFSTIINLNGRLISSIFVLLSTYFMVFVFFIIYSFKISINKTILKNTIIIFVLAQCMLGIIQHISSKTIVSTEYQGKNILNPVFYINGISSNNPLYLNYGASIRAFGITDSGLTLGLFALTLFAILIFKKKSIIDYLGIALSLTAIYMTMTRVIFVSLLLLLFYIIIFKKNNYKIIKIFFFLFIFIQVSSFFMMPILIKILNIIGFNHIETLVSRYEGYKYFFQFLPPNLFTILFGSNYSMRQFEIVSAYSIDNEFLKYYFDIGILGYLLVLSTYYVAMINKLYDANLYNYFEKGIMMMCLLYPFIGIFNVGNYFFFFLMTILYIVSIENKKLL